MVKFILSLQWPCTKNFYNYSKVCQFVTIPWGSSPASCNWVSSPCSWHDISLGDITGCYLLPNNGTLTWPVDLHITSISLSCLWIPSHTIYSYPWSVVGSCTTASFLGKSKLQRGGLQCTIKLNYLRHPFWMVNWVSWYPIKFMGPEVSAPVETFLWTSIPQKKLTETKESPSWTNHMKYVVKSMI